MFVLDSSGSIRDNNPPDRSYDNWDLLLNFVVGVIDRLTISSSATRVGVVRFSGNARSMFYLNTYMNDKNGMKEAVRNIGYVGSNTHTAAGIIEMMTNQFTSEHGDRLNVQNYAIIITDGVSTINKESTIPEAERARDRGITVFSIGITTAIDENELRMMSSQPQQESRTYWKSASFQMLPDITDELVSQTCATPAPGKYYMLG